jgi:hypothetical protein
VGGGAGAVELYKKDWPIWERYADMERGDDEEDDDCCCGTCCEGFDDVVETDFCDENDGRNDDTLEKGDVK